MHKVYTVACQPFENNMYECRIFGEAEIARYTTLQNTTQRRATINTTSTTSAHLPTHTINTVYTRIKQFTYKKLNNAKRYNNNKAFLTSRKEHYVADAWRSAKLILLLGNALPLDHEPFA
jgi:hypothetical protein